MIYNTKILLSYSHRFLLCVILCLSVMKSAAGNSLDSLLNELDRTIRDEQVYNEQKVNYINNLQFKLSASSLTDEDRYLLYQQLAKEYESFRCDTAIIYSTERLALAVKTGNMNWVNESKFQLAAVLSKACMFEKAIGILESVDKSSLTAQQLVLFYRTYLSTYIYMTEFYQHGYEIDELSDKREVYRDSLLMVMDPNSFEYAVHYGTRYIESGELDRAENLLFSYYPKLWVDTKDYAMFTSIVAYFYERKGDMQKRLEYLVKSAIADIKVANKENISLRFLATLIFDEGDVKRANLYIKKSMEDANFYNGRLRNFQNSRIFPIINEAYQHDRTVQQRKLTLLLIVVSFLLLILIATFCFVVRQMKKLSRAKQEIMRINERLNELNGELQVVNEAQKEMNRSLADANHIKEQLISSFLDICTEYIEKFEKFKIFVNRKIKAGQGNDLLKITADTDSAAQELKEFYANFDRAFLAIYPDFVKEFNMLLRPEERYPEKEEHSLNQELRIFALVRLGITDRNKIATFLHYTVRTVYNYRHKVKSKAINQDDDFEEQVREICSPDSQME